MAYWSIALLLISISFLAFRHPDAAIGALPRWLRPAKRRSGQDGKDEPADSPQHNGNGNGFLKGSEVVVDSESLFEGETTPKANTEHPDISVPTFTLDDAFDTEKSEATKAESANTPSSFPASNSPQRASSMMPPPKPAATSAKISNGNLMAPPPRPSIASAPGSASALRVPSNGPLPNRGLPANSQQRVGGGLTVSGTVSTPNPRGKVLLSPGHSPMDWAELTRKGNFSGVNTFQRVTPSVLKSMTGRKGKPAWSSFQGNVYNITPYLPFHPGGEPEIMKAAGRDGTKLFMEVHPWVNWDNMLQSCLVGVMVPEHYGVTDGQQTSLEEID